MKPDESANWNMGVGFVTKHMIQDHMPEPSKDTLILVCGPPVFTEMIKSDLIDLGYSDDMIFVFWVQKFDFEVQLW